ncbi:uncharacterized protein LOC9632820 isoform X2 [Selaginella moellendorffii]|uniref:uncharacterized protein LOC9632820 isoform X2 n=1 Tax=Selaginella moellendorffii TaxID=88036 RepID=UPI000D1C7E0B|nr:uncharacterized protein LOC9632820 isoform X2 [Selaginella moellendorffii]|eukprot:XP_024528574.1 uncharacterized protein LOC9632820 isoform X2 [Selaginella moellendorffii]
MGVAHLADNRHTKPFLLAGGKPDEQSQRGFGFGALIHGFSSGVLSRAWELDKSSVRDVLEGQSGVGIVKVDEDITFPDATNAFDRSRSIPTFASKTVERSESSAATSFLFYEPWDLVWSVREPWSLQIGSMVAIRSSTSFMDEEGSRSWIPVAREFSTQNWNKGRSLSFQLSILPARRASITSHSSHPTGL